MQKGIKTITFLYEKMLLFLNVFLCLQELNILVNKVPKMYTLYACFTLKEFAIFSVLLECPKGQYGRTCSRQCGNCLNEMSCDHISGACYDGCSSGWMGDKCDQS